MLWLSSSPLPASVPVCSSSNAKLSCVRPKPTSADTPKLHNARIKPQRSQPFSEKKLRELNHVKKVLSAHRIDAFIPRYFPSALHRSLAAAERCESKLLFLGGVISLSLMRETISSMTTESREAIK